jgi:hypothetical protein
MKSIPFLVTMPEETEKNDQMGFGFRGSDIDIRVKQIPVDVLKNNLANISASILDVLMDIEQVGKFKLKEVTLEVEVSANGGVSLIGTANLGGKGAISLKFSE